MLMQQLQQAQVNVLGVVNQLSIHHHLLINLHNQVIRLHPSILNCHHMLTQKHLHHHQINHHQPDHHRHLLKNDDDLLQEFFLALNPIFLLMT